MNDENPNQKLQKIDIKCNIRIGHQHSIIIEYVTTSCTYKGLCKYSQAQFKDHGWVELIFAIHKPQTLFILSSIHSFTHIFRPDCRKAKGKCLTRLRS